MIVTTSACHQSSQLLPLLLNTSGKHKHAVIVSIRANAKTREWTRNFSPLFTDRRDGHRAPLKQMPDKSAWALFGRSNRSEASREPESCLTMEHPNLVPDSLERHRTNSDQHSGVHGVRRGSAVTEEIEFREGSARWWARRFMRKASIEVKPVSANLDAFFECFAAHHAIVDPLTGRFNLTRKEHDEVVSILRHMLEKHGRDGLLPLSEFDSPSLSQRWAFTSKGVLSVSTCNRIIQLVRVSAFGNFVDVKEFTHAVLTVESPRIRRFLNISLKLLIVIVYYILGCLFYCHYEKWSIMDSVYFVTIGVSTIGYGDQVCRDDNCRLFTVFYIGLGIILVVGVITSSITSILDGYQDRVKELGKGIIEVNSQSRRQRKAFFLYGLHIVYATLLLGFPLLLGSILFYVFASEDMHVTAITALYWSLQTCATIGWGDLPMKEEWNKFWICCFVFLAIACVSAAITQIGSLKMTMNAYERLELLQNKRMAVSLISQLDVGGNGVDKFEFLAAMLVALEKVKPGEVSDILNQFDQLDVEKRGVLTVERLASLRHTHKLARLVSGIPSGLGRLTSDETLEGMTRYIAPYALSRSRTPTIDEETRPPL